MTRRRRQRIKRNVGNVPPWDAHHIRQLSPVAPAEREGAQTAHPPKHPFPLHRLPSELQRLEEEAVAEAAAPFDVGGPEAALLAAQAGIVHDGGLTQPAQPIPGPAPPPVGLVAVAGAATVHAVLPVQDARTAYRHGSSSHLGDRKTCNEAFIDCFCDFHIQDDKMKPESLTLLSLLPVQISLPTVSYFDHSIQSCANPLVLSWRLVADEKRRMGT